MRRTSSFLLASLLAASVAGAGCSNRQRIHTETELAKALISDEQENELGLKVHQELEKQNIRYLDDPTVNAYVDGIARKILPLASKDRPGVKWHIHIVDDPQQVNAFATPGGHLYVFTGLLLAAGNEAEVAGVLAHEAGHVVGRHSARQMVNALGLETVASLALGENPPLLAQIAATIAAQGTMLAHTRSEEVESDAYGVKYLAGAGYDPRAMGTFFQKLAKKEGNVPRGMVWLSSHPLTPDRVKYVNRRAKQYAVRGGGVTNAPQHDAVRQHIQRLSPQAGQPVHTH